MNRLSILGSIFLFLLLAITPPVSTQGDCGGFVLVSCYDVGSSSYCPLGRADGIYVSSWASVVATGCYDCQFNWGDYWREELTTDCEGEYHYYTFYGCCGA